MQPLVRQKIALLGGGERWLAELPDLIAELERRWLITVGQPIMEGTASFVARVHTADGQAAVLKLALPAPAFANEVRTLRDAQGRGYARLLAHDVERHAALLEALGPSLARLGLTPERQIVALCATLPRAWDVPRPADMTVLPSQEKARALGELVSRLWKHLGHPCSARVADRAIECARRRAAGFDLDRCVVVHGDPHPGNVLQVVSPRPGAESGFVFVDPDGFLADPASDLGVVLRDWCAELLAGNALALARRYCALLAAQSGADETAIWEWGFLERVSTGLYILECGAERLSRPFLDTAELLA